MDKKIKPLKFLVLFILVIFLFILTKEAIRRHYVKVVELEKGYEFIGPATLLDDGNVLLIVTDSDYETRTGKIFDPKTNKLKDIKNGKKYTASEVALKLDNGKVLFQGQKLEEEFSPIYNEIYDPFKEEFVLKSKIDFCIDDFPHSINEISNKKVLSTCGISKIYNYEKDETESIKSKFLIDFNIISTTLNDGRILFIGDNLEYQGKADLYNLTKEEDIKNIKEEDFKEINNLFFDPKTNSFSKAPDMNYNRFAAQILDLKDGRKVVVGGYKTGERGNGFNFIKEIEIYDPKTNEFKVAGRIKSVRNLYNHYGILIDENRIYFPGNSDIIDDIIGYGSKGEKSTELSRGVSTILEVAALIGTPIMAKFKSPKCEVFDLRTGKSKYTNICQNASGRIWDTNPIVITKNKKVIIPGAGKNHNKLLIINTKGIK